MQNLKKRLAAVLAGIFIVMPFAVFADDVNEITAENGEEAAAYVSSVIDFLAAYARYDEVNRQSMYKAGLMAALKAEPSLYEPVMRAVLASVDEHSAYFTKEETDRFLSALSDEFAGIGIVSQAEGNRVYVRSVMADAPAQRAGIMPGDLIVSIDGADVSEISADETLSLLRGEAATQVNVGVFRADTGENLTFSMLRETIVTPSVQYEIKEENGTKVFYIKVRAFNKGTADEFKAAIKKADEEKIKKIIVDLRDNGGGILGEAIAMAEIFLPPGAVITTEEHKVPIFNSVYKSGNSRNPDYETVVLINENSASASEVFAAALHDNKKATIIGERSYGKGTVQYIKPLKDEASMKYTSAFYLTPNGSNINGVGIVPDATVENTAEPVDMSEYNEFSYRNVYRMGDRGEDIKTAKELLALIGIYGGEIDDVFNAETDLAVRYFQRASGLYSYGDLDITTQIQLWNSVEAAKHEKDEQLAAAMSNLLP